MSRRAALAALLVSARRVGSLCCECGTFKPGVVAGRNVADTNYPLYDPDYARERLADAERCLMDEPERKVTQAYHATWLNEVEHEFENRTCDLKCSTCGRDTRHATVAGGGVHDCTEEYNYRGGSLREALRENNGTAD